MQVIQVKPINETDRLGTTVSFFDDENQRWAIAGDVIELTEEQTSRRLGSPVPTQGHRWVSEWERLDGD